jgi:hypothetical protein
MTTAQAAEARFRWLCRVAERLGCQVRVGDYGDTEWGGRGGRVPDGPRVVQVNIGCPLDELAPHALEAIEEALGLGTGIDLDAARWITGMMFLLHELGHALLGHTRSQGPRDRQEYEANDYRDRALIAIYGMGGLISAGSDVAEEAAAETLERIGAEMVRERAAVH